MAPPRPLHAVTEDEAKILGARSEALRLFTARYRHNDETRRAMTGALQRLVNEFTRGEYTWRTFPWEMLVDSQLTETLWRDSARNHARRTVERDASALRMMLRCCYHAGLLSYDEYQDARDFDTAHGHGYDLPPAGTYLTSEDVGKIAHACLTGTGNHGTRVRDLALLLTMASSGCRAVEVSGIQVEDVDLAQRRIWLRRTKGGHPRNAWLHPTATAAIERWLEYRGPLPGALFPPLSRVGRPLLTHDPISVRQVWKIISGRAAQAGLPTVAPHDLRRFMISSLLTTHDLTLVCRIAGHRRPETTAGYDRRPSEQQRAAVETLELPTMEDLLASPPEKPVAPSFPRVTKGKTPVASPPTPTRAAAT